MSVDNTMKKYLKEDMASTGGLTDLGGYDVGKDAASLSTGLKRLGFYFKRANTPRKFQIAFTLAADLVDKFPMKAKLVWSAVADAHSTRFEAPPEA